MSGLFRFYDSLFTNQSQGEAQINAAPFMKSLIAPPACGAFFYLQKGATSSTDSTVMNSSCTSTW